MLSVLSACGGSGGGGSGGGPVSGAFTISANSATFSARQNGVLPSSQSLTIQISGPNAAYAGAAYTGGQTPPPWLGFTMNGSGTTYQLVLTVTSTALAPGQYTTTFQVGTADSKGNILQSQSVTVTLTVLAIVAITTQPYSATFMYGGSKTADSVSVAVSAPGLQWKSTSDSPWLTVPTGTQSGTGSVQAAISVASLSPGTYQGHVTITDAADGTNSATLDFSVIIQAPTLSVTQSSVLLGGVDGLSTSTPQSIAFSVSTDTAVHPFAITFETDSGGSWLTSNVTTGTVNAAGAEIQVSGDKTGLVGGTYTGRVKIAATVGDLVLTGEVPVTFNIEANRIVVGASGVGFSSSPAGSVLTRKVTVFSTIGRTDVAWQATSDQPSWLTVTPSGVTGGAITLTAHPSGLSTDTTHFATVTVTSPDASVENQETIRVGLYVNSATPSDLSQLVAEGFVATSPVEPIAFLSDGGTDVTGYNVYTGAIDRTFAGIVAHAGKMVVSADGRYLFVYDQTNQQVTELDAVSGSVIHRYSSIPMVSLTMDTALAYMRPDGYPMLVTPSSRVYDLGTGTEYDKGTIYGVTSSASLGVSPDNSKLVTDGGTVFSVARSSLNGGQFNVALLFNTGTVLGSESQACISGDGQTVYTADGYYPSNFSGASLATQLVTQTLVLPAALGTIPNTIACVWNGLVVGGVDDNSSATDVFVYYGPTGAQLAALDSSAQTSNRDLGWEGLAVSADGTRLITVVARNGSTLGSEVRFQSLPAPP